MKYYLIAGEASGDLHGSNLIKSLQQVDPNAEFRYWGGDLMQKVIGQEPVKHISELAFMGFVEVIANLGTIRQNIKLCKTDILAFNPDVVILIDYPGFNLRMARFAHENGIKTSYYISPQLWAWKEGRIKSIKRFVDQMLCILPFEKTFYQERGYLAEYVGHPLLDVINYDFTKTHPDANRPIALIPGSRKQEIKTALPLFLQVAEKMGDEKFVITGAPAIDAAFYSQFHLPTNVSLVFGKTHEVMKDAKAALVTSGTATLETALSGTPMMVCYRANPISVAIARRVIRVKYISLVNLILNEPIVKELIQEDFNVANCLSQLQNLLEKDNYDRQMASFQHLKTLLGGRGASQRAALAIQQLIIV